MTETMMGKIQKTFEDLSIYEKAKGYLKLKSNLHFSARSLRKGTIAD